MKIAMITSEANPLCKSGGLADVVYSLSREFNKVNKDILLKISHIEYKPNEVDKERFILYMVD